MNIMIMMHSHLYNVDISECGDDLYNVDISECGRLTRRVGAEPPARHRRHRRPRARESEREREIVSFLIDNIVVNGSAYKINVIFLR